MAKSQGPPGAAEAERAFPRGPRDSVLPAPRPQSWPSRTLGDPLPATLSPPAMEASWLRHSWKAQLGGGAVAVIPGCKGQARRHRQQSTGEKTITACDMLSTAAAWLGCSWVNTGVGRSWQVQLGFPGLELKPASGTPPWPSWSSPLRPHSRHYVISPNGSGTVHC